MESLGSRTPFEGQPLCKLLFADYPAHISAKLRLWLKWPVKRSVNAFSGTDSHSLLHRCRDRAATRCN
jgi:hypothetical protein